MEAPPSREQWKRLCRLHDRKIREETGLRLLEGPRLVEEALRAGQVQQIFAVGEAGDRWRERAPGLPVHGVTVRDMERLCQVATPQDVAAVGPRSPRLPLEGWLPQHDRILAFDGVQDPGNVGTLARTAAGLGVTGLIALPGTADPDGGKVLRASAGALFRLVFAETSAPSLLAAVASSGHRLVVPVVAGGEDLRKVGVPNRFVLVAGNEGQGSSLVAEGMLPVTIPLAQATESLNVSAALAVILGLWWLQR